MINIVKEQKERKRCLSIKRDSGMELNESRNEMG